MLHDKWNDPLEGIIADNNDEQELNGPKELAFTKNKKWIRGDTIVPKNIEWLWEGRLIMNGFNIIAGMGGHGKDILCCTIAATKSTGRNWPDGKPCKPGYVGYVSFEDNLEDTLVPRLIAAGADMSKIVIFDKNWKIEPADIEDLSLVIISPIANIMNGRDINKENDVRHVITTWQGMSEKNRCCLIGIIHYNKKNDLAAVQRILGAVGMVNAPRSVWCVERDDEDRDTLLFLSVKNNLLPAGTEGLQYTIRHIGPYSQSVVCTWLSDRTTKTADQVIQANIASKGKPSAGAWLKAFLRGKGDVQSETVIKAAEEEGHKETAIKKAFQRLSEVGDVSFDNIGEYPRRTYWRLTR